MLVASRGKHNKVRLSRWHTHRDSPGGYNMPQNFTRQFVFNTPPSLLVRMFFSFFFTPNLWGHWTDLNQAWTHIHLWLLFDKFGSNSSGHLPPQAGGEQNRFFDFELWPNISLQWNIYQQLERNSVYRDSPTCPQIWSRNGWERLASFCPPPKFLHWETASLTACASYNSRQTLVRIM